MKVLKFGILIGLLSVVQVAFAELESDREAEKLMNIMGMENSMDKLMSQMIDIQLQQNPSLAQFKPVMMKFFDKHLSWESLRPELVKMYSEAFTVSELREINAFYETETGKKAITLMPSMASQGGQIGVARVQANLGELEAMIKAESERLQKLNE